MRVYKEGDYADIHLAGELIESNIKSFHVPCGLWDGYLEERNDGWYVLAYDYDADPEASSPRGVVRLQADDVRDIRIVVLTVRDERSLVSSAANCANGYPYDDVCDRCATEELAGDSEHRHCYVPSLSTRPQWPTEYSYSDQYRGKDVVEHVMNFRTTDSRLFNVIKDLLDSAIESERSKGRR